MQTVSTLKKRTLYPVLSVCLNWCTDKTHNTNYHNTNCPLFQFESFNTADSNDYVKLKDGRHSNSPVIQQYSGKHLPKVYLSSQPYMYLVFVTDHTSSGKGFKASYKTGNCNCYYLLLILTREFFTEFNKYFVKRLLPIVLSQNWKNKFRQDTSG